jgi:signal transduction histidine kinase
LCRSLSLIDAPVPVYGNFDRLTQVVVNLLSNAIKFADDEQGQVHLRCYQGAKGGYIEVQDNGPGISPRDQELIFEKFTQISDSDKGKPQGSGLGLFITHTIVSQHQGRLSVESAPGEGATFKVTLPLYTEQPGHVVQPSLQ